MYSLKSLDLSKCKLCESSKLDVRFYEDAISSCLFTQTDFAIGVIHLWSLSWFFGDVQCYFAVFWCYDADNRSVDILCKVENLFMSHAIDMHQASSPTSGKASAIPGM